MYEYYCSWGCYMKSAGHNRSDIWGKSETVVWWCFCMCQLIILPSDPQSPPTPHSNPPPASYRLLELAQLIWQNRVDALATRKPHSSKGHHKWQLVVFSSIYALEYNYRAFSFNPNYNCRVFRAQILHSVLEWSWERAKGKVNEGWKVWAERERDRIPHCSQTIFKNNTSGFK